MCTLTISAYQVVIVRIFIVRAFDVCKINTLHEAGLRLSLVKFSMINFTDEKGEGIMLHFTIIDIQQIEPVPYA
jgi:hypothetical protein